jgi:hypothetical protein
MQVSSLRGKEEIVESYGQFKPQWYLHVTPDLILNISVFCMENIYVVYEVIISPG